MNWININDELPEWYKEVLVYYEDKDGSNPGITKASLQLDNTWLVDTFNTLKGEDFYEEDSIITHWFDYQNNLNYPNK